MPVIQLVIIQVIAFAVLIFIMQKVMLSSSAVETKRLQRLTWENTQKSQQLDRKLNEAEKVYKERIMTAEEEVKKLKSMAHQEMDEYKEEVLAQAKKEKEHLINQAINSKEKMREEIAAQMHAQGIETVQKIIRQLFDSDKHQMIHQGFMKEVLEELKDLDSSIFSGLNSDSSESILVQVRSSCEMDQAHCQSLETTLSSKIGGKVRLELDIDKQMFAGLSIKVGNFVIDGSLKEKIRKAAEKITNYT